MELSRISYGGDGFRDRMVHGFSRGQAKGKGGGVYRAIELVWGLDMAGFSGRCWSCVWQVDRSKINSRWLKIEGWDGGKDGRGGCTGLMVAKGLTL